MSQYDLNTILSWARRTGGDRTQRIQEEVTANGAATYTLSNAGNIVVAGIAVGGTAAATTDYGVAGNVITFATGHIPVTGTEMVVEYDYSRYTDDEMLDFLADAARLVQSDLDVDWTIGDDYKIDDPNDTMLNAAGRVDDDIERLIVQKTAVVMYEDKANTAADDSIKIRDGDTSIDTGATSQATETARRRVGDQYELVLTRIRSRRFTGRGQYEFWGRRGHKGHVHGPYQSHP